MIPLRYLIATELRMGLRARPLPIAAVVLAVLGLSVGSLEGNGAAMSAYATGEAACRFLSVFAAIWAGLGAMRDTAQRVDVLIFTKPQPPERLGIARFCGIFGQLVVLLAALFLGAMVGRAFTGHSVLGYSAYALQFARALGVLFVASGLGFSLALLAESAIAGGLAGLALVVALSGKAFLAKYYFPWYTQNLPAFLMATLAVLCLALWTSRRRLRGARPAALTVRLLTPAAAAASAWLFVGLARTGHDPMARQDPGLERMSTQNLAMGARVPGFLLPDQRGKPTALSQFPGKILLVALWTPQETDSALLMAEMAALQRRYGAQGVQAVAICLSEDSSAPATFAAGEDLPFPVVHDWGTHHAVQQMENSPMALAYRADHLPLLVVTDRRHRARANVIGATAYSRRELGRMVEQRLKAEPE